MSIDGTWNVTLQTPMGAQTGTLTFATDGEHSNFDMDLGPWGDIVVCKPMITFFCEFFGNDW